MPVLLIVVLSLYLFLKVVRRWLTLPDSSDSSAPILKSASVEVTVFSTTRVSDHMLILANGDDGNVYFWMTESMSKDLGFRKFDCPVGWYKHE